MAWRQQLVGYWVGSNYSEKWTTIYTQDNPAPVFGAAGAIHDAMMAASDGALVAARLQPVAVYSNVPGVGPYSNAGDYCKLVFSTAARRNVEINLPAPKAEIFLADATTPDEGNPLVQNIITAVLAAASDSAGNPALGYVGGERFKRKL